MHAYNNEHFILLSDNIRQEPQPYLQTFDVVMQVSAMKASLLEGLQSNFHSSTQQQRIVMKTLTFLENVLDSLVKWLNKITKTAPDQVSRHVPYTIFQV